MQLMPSFSFSCSFQANFCEDRLLHSNPALLHHFTFSQFISSLPVVATSQRLRCAFCHDPKHHLRTHHSLRNLRNGRSMSSLHATTARPPPQKFQLLTRSLKNAGSQPRPYAQAAAQQTNGGPPMPTPMPGAIPLLPNQGRVIQQGPVRVLCIADVRGMFAKNRASKCP